MRILVFGCGAIGSAFGGFLSRSTHEISLYGRSWHLDRLRRSGLKVSGIWGTHLFRRFRIHTRFSELLKRKRAFDLVLLTVKSFDTERACKELKRIVSPQTLILSLQNGLGNIETLHQFFPPRQVLAGRVIFGVEIHPGRIRITVWADDVLIGETERGDITTRLKAIAHLFSRWGIRTRAVRRIVPEIWTKVMYNVALNGLASVLGVHYGALLETVFTRQIMRELVSEAYRVASRMRIHLRPRHWEAYIRLLFRRLIPVTYAHRPSMLQDLERGRRTEIDALNGAIVQLALRLGISTPTNEFLTLLLKSKEILPN